MAVTLAFLALLIEAIVGYPDRLVHAIGHPVTWMGRLIGLLDRTLNHDSMSDARRRAAGAAAVLVIIGVAATFAYVLERSLLLLPFGIAPAALAASTLIAQRSLYDHVLRVAAALEQNGAAAGREAVSHIVGRDPETLDEGGVARAAIESLAENFSDAIVAPVFWLSMGGLAGGTVYKAINTADSMIGHRTPRYADFGWAAARLDDLVNLPASRFAALLLILASALRNDASASAAWRTVRRDATRHRSPNAGYPEAAMAGALGLSLAGPRFYAGIRVEDAFMGDGRREAEAKDIRRALALYRCADAILLALLAGLTAVLIALN